MLRPASTPCGVNHVAVVTEDLDVYRAFYEDTIGLETALVLAPGPGHGRQAIVFAGDVMLHVFEVADRGSRAPGNGSAMLRRGLLDHLGFTVRDEAALSELRRRLMDVGASTGDIRPLGWMLSVRFVDPDGFEGEVNCVNPHYDPSTLRDEDEVIDPHWLDRARRALQADDDHDDGLDQTRGGGRP
jgi:catechol 2,3-dioxygenase-like lactoylglutathione lyase family enzyme